MLVVACNFDCARLSHTICPYLELPPVFDVAAYSDVSRELCSFAFPFATTCRNDKLPHGRPDSSPVSTSSGSGAVYAAPARCWLTSLRSDSSRCNRTFSPDTPSVSPHVTDNGTRNPSVTYETFAARSDSVSCVFRLDPSLMPSLLRVTSKRTPRDSILHAT